MHRASQGEQVGTVEVSKTTKEELSRMMVGRDIDFTVKKAAVEKGRDILEVKDITVPSRIHKTDAVRGVSFNVRWRRNPLYRRHRRQRADRARLRACRA